MRFTSDQGVGGAKDHKFLLEILSHSGGIPLEAFNYLSKAGITPQVHGTAYRAYIVDDQSGAEDNGPNFNKGDDVRYRIFTSADADTVSSITASMDTAGSGPQFKAGFALTGPLADAIYKGMANSGLRPTGSSVKCGPGQDPSNCPVIGYGFSGKNINCDKSEQGVQCRVWFSTQDPSSSTPPSTAGAASDASRLPATVNMALVPRSAGSTEVQDHNSKQPGGTQDVHSGPSPPTQAGTAPVK